MKSTSRTLRIVSAVLALLAQIQPIRAEPLLGIQTWTLRNLNFDQVVEFADNHQIKHLQLIGNHMDPMAPIEE